MEGHYKIIKTLFYALRVKLVIVCVLGYKNKWSHIYGMAPCVKVYKSSYVLIIRTLQLSGLMQAIVQERFSRYFHQISTTYNIIFSKLMLITSHFKRLTLHVIVYCTISIANYVSYRTLIIYIYIIPGANTKRS